MTTGCGRGVKTERQLCQAMKIADHDTDLTDARWTLVEPMLPPPRHLGRPRTDLRCILNALLDAAKAGCQWRLLPKEFPAWQRVYPVFRKWTRAHIGEALNARLRALVRGRIGKRPRPTAAILDSQGVKSDPHGGGLGHDAAKKIKGRKRHLRVDTLGLWLGVHVTPALLARVLPGSAWLRLLWVDGGHTGTAFAACIHDLRPKLAVTVVKRSDKANGFTVLARRWFIERTFGWLLRHRRLVPDHETSTSSAKAFVLLAMIRVPIRRSA